MSNGYKILLRGSITVFLAYHVTVSHAYISDIASIDKSQYVEVRPGEELVLSFSTLGPEPNAPRESAGVGVNIAMESAYHFVRYDGPLTPISGSTDTVEHLARSREDLPSVTLELFENRNDATPQSSRIFQPDGAHGIYFGHITDTLWKDHEGMIKIKPRDAVFRVYAYKLNRADPGQAYSTGIVPLRQGMPIFAPGESGNTSPIINVEGSIAAGYPAGSIMGLSCGAVSSREKAMAVLSIATSAGKSYQLQSCHNLSSGIWISQGEPIPGTGGPVDFNFPVDCENVFYRVLEIE